MKIGRITFGPSIESNKVVAIKYRPGTKEDPVRQERNDILALILRSQEKGLTDEQIVELILERVKCFHNWMITDAGYSSCTRCGAVLVED